MESQSSKYTMLYKLKELLEDYLVQSAEIDSRTEANIVLLGKYREKIGGLTWSPTKKYEKNSMSYFLNINGKQSSRIEEEYNLPNLNIANFDVYEFRKRYAAILGSFYFFGGLGEPLDEEIQALDELIKENIEGINEQIQSYEKLRKKIEKRCEWCEATLEKLNELLDAYNKDDISDSIDRGAISSIIKYIHFAYHLQKLSVEEKIEMIRELNAFVLEVVERDEKIVKQSTEPFKAEYKPKDKQDFEDENEEDMQFVIDCCNLYKDMGYWISNNKELLDELEFQFGNIDGLASDEELTPIKSFISSFGESKKIDLTEFFTYLYLKRVNDAYNNYLNDDNPINYRRYFKAAIKSALKYQDYADNALINEENGNDIDDVNNLIFLTVEGVVNNTIDDNHFLGIDFINNDTSHDMYPIDYRDFKKGIRKLRKISVENLSKGKGYVKGATLYDRERGLSIDSPSFHKHRENDMRMVYINLSHLVSRKYFDAYLSDMKPCYIVAMFGKKTTNGNNLYDTMTVDKKGGSNYVQLILLKFYDYINQTIKKIVTSTKDEKRRKEKIQAFITDFIRRNNEVFSNELKTNAKNYSKILKKQETNTNSDSLDDEGGSRK